MIKLTDLKLSHQLAYFKKAVLDEVKRILYQHTKLKQYSKWNRS